MSQPSILKVLQGVTAINTLCFTRCHSHQYLKFYRVSQPSILYVSQGVTAINTLCFTGCHSHQYFMLYRVSQPSILYVLQGVTAINTLCFTGCPSHQHFMFYRVAQPLKLFILQGVTAINTWYLGLSKQMPIILIRCLCHVLRALYFASHTTKLKNDTQTLLYLKGDDNHK